MKRLETGSRQMKSSGLDHIAMSDHHNVSVRMGRVELPGNAGDAFGNVDELFVDKFELCRVVEISLQLPGEQLAEGIPGVAFPPLGN